MAQYTVRFWLAGAAPWGACARDLLFLNKTVRLHQGRPSAKQKSKCQSILISSSSATQGAPWPSCGGSLWSIFKAKKPPLVLSPTSSIPRFLLGTTLISASLQHLWSPLHQFGGRHCAWLITHAGSSFLCISFELRSVPSSPSLFCEYCPNVPFLWVKPFVHNLSNLHTMLGQWWHRPCKCNQLMSDLI